MDWKHSQIIKAINLSFFHVRVTKWYFHHISTYIWWFSSCQKNSLFAASTVRSFVTSSLQTLLPFKIWSKWQWTWFSAVMTTMSIRRSVAVCKEVGNFRPLTLSFSILQSKRLQLYDACVMDLPTLRMSPYWHETSADIGTQWNIMESTAHSQWTHKNVTTCTDQLAYICLASHE